MGAVAWATGLDANGAPADEIDEFPRDGERIHAAVDVTGLSRGVSFEASWTINGMPVEGIGQTVVIDEPAPAGWVSFSLVWEGEVLWPVGTLGVTITASSGEATSGEIRIVSGQ
jgi:hypothetical protein